MGLLDNVEKRLNQLVNGSFSKAFKSELQPVEIAATLQQEIDLRIRQDNNRTLAPNQFIVGLSVSDYNRLAPYLSSLAVELAGVVTKYCVEQRYAMVDRPNISFDSDGSLNLGDIRVSSTITELQLATTAAANSPADQPLVPQSINTPAVTPLLRSITGQDYPLNRSVTNIGRGQDAHIQLDDSGVSRLHCTIVLGNEVLLEDHGSTNGTLVDGKRVTEAVLRNGSIIKIGNTTLTYLVG